MVKIIVVGGSFAGLTCALEVKRKLGRKCEVKVISKSPLFIFIPSLIWVPFGKNLQDITIPIEPVTAKAGVEFICTEATKILPEEKILRCTEQDFRYDYLVIATGPEWMFDQVDGLGLESNISFIVTPETAMETRQRWLDFIKHPGPVVIGATQGAQCVGPAYEFLFNFEKRCRDVGIRKRVDITFITPEPFLGHLGLGGMTGSRYLLKKFFSFFKINYITNSEIKKVTRDNIMLNNGRSLPYKFSAIMPAYKGVQMVRNSPGVGDKDAFVRVNTGYQHKVYPDIFGVGIAADLPAVLKTPVKTGIPKSGYISDVSAKTAAQNIARLVNGKHHLKKRPMKEIPELCILDAGDKEMVAVAERLLTPRKFSIVVPNPINNFGKIAVEKYYLWKVKHRYSWLP